MIWLGMGKSRRISGGMDLSTGEYVDIEAIHRQDERPMWPGDVGRHEEVPSAPFVPPRNPEPVYQPLPEVRLRPVAPEVNPSGESRNRKRLDYTTLDIGIACGLEGTDAEVSRKVSKMRSRGGFEWTFSKAVEVVIKYHAGKKLAKDFAEKYAQSIASRESPDE